MVKKLLGYLLATIGFIGFGFFRNYHGTLIPLSIIWFFVSILIGIVGIYLIFTSKTVKHTTQEKYNTERLKNLKQNGEKILLTVDNCEIRENSYYEEVAQRSSSYVQTIDALYEPNRNYEQKFIEQSAIVFYYTNGDQKIRMTSQSFFMNAKTLQNYIQDKMINLYVNRLDKNDYFFVKNI